MDPVNIPHQAFAENAVERDIAVIDVGSNTVRMVHFRLEGRAIWPVFNEKVMAGLGRGLRQRGTLHPDNIDIAMRALKRFERLLDAKGVSERYAVATAAVRNASDGPDFVRRVAAETSFRLRVLSGPEEGELSAFGLVTGIPGAHGMMGDLGGSSLELTPLDHGMLGAGQTFALGPQEAIPPGPWDADAVCSVIDERLREDGVLRGQGGEFYAIGGAWRSLAQLAFARSDYPLRVAHQFRIDARRVRELTRLASRLSTASLAGIPGISSRRAPSIPYAALLLSRIVEMGKFSHVVFSAYGLREGVLMQGLPESVRAIDPLIAGAEALARPVSPTPDFGRSLARWIAPAMANVDTVFTPRRDRVLQETAARLADLGARRHPDHRLELTRDSVLYAPFAGINHAERAFLAAVMHYRYGGRRSALDDLAVFHLIDEAQHDVAQMLGCTLRLGAKLSGRSASLLDRFTLRVEPGLVCLDVDESVRDLYVERSVSLLGTLAGAIGRKGEVRYL
ncbi:Ppx/GppA family phosphatase [Maricaulis sp.]|uniref:Ppx/GppA phosphatase family protein n=1 Tax=Maricaulis sp. TaxID=1486257 RepID=UPI003A92034F